MTLPETSTPIIAAALVGGIGLLGILAGIVACRQVFAEGRTLDQGEDKLAVAISSSDLDSADPVTWLASNDLPKDSHFGDHLLSVWCGWLGERVPTLAELHSLSARRERRRLSARISGGITALLLVCGIAGTLLCIHPILQAFTIPVNANNEVLIDPLVAQKLIRSLGSAFLPSLTALAFTVVVAIFRGIYLQSTTGLAWRLDRFAVAQLFPMFKPKRFGSELTEVHLKLSRLVDRLDERDQKFADGVEIFGDAALGFKESGPKLKAASDRISKAADKLANETESISKALDTHLGEDSALSKGTNSLKEILETCLDTSKQLREGGITLAKSLADASDRFEIARTQFGASIAGIPRQIEQGCDSANKILIDASGNLQQAHEILTAAVARIPLQIEQGSVAAISKAADAVALGINSAAADVQKEIQTSSVNAGEVFTRAASMASNQAATAIGQAVDSATKSIKAEVQPITQVGAEMLKQLDAATVSYANAGKVISQAASEASILAATTIGQAAEAATKCIRAEVGPIAQVAMEMRKQLGVANIVNASAGNVITRGVGGTPNQVATARGQVDGTVSTSSKPGLPPSSQAANEGRQMGATGHGGTKAYVSDYADRPGAPAIPGADEANNRQADKDQPSIDTLGRRPKIEDPPKTPIWKRIASFGVIK